MVFYSDEFTNFPLSLDLTGKNENFKITITDFELYLRDFLFLIVPGDTLYQTGAVKDGVSEYNFQLKNPKSEKMKSYIIYGNEGDISIWDWEASLCYL